MKRTFSKEIILLALPCLLLLGCGVLLPQLDEKPKVGLVLTSVTVTSNAMERSRWTPYPPDVNVHARFDYKKSFQERYIRPNWRMSLSNAYILDGAGKKHYMMSRKPLNQRFGLPDGQSIAPNIWSSDRAEFPLWLCDFPKSAGKLTFCFTATAHDGFKLPVSVVVRN